MVLILAVLLGTVIIGGIKSIAKVTEKLVPFMAAIYILCALVIIILNFELIGNSFSINICWSFYWRRNYWRNNRSAYSRF